ncbi:MAG: hypothetical protein E5Y67_12315 [Mesorhizobium sp.]|uniref:hypothetical protein n=1 Tax=Mesorhizobium sp. TaxID=1871066 RepID=UPI001225DC7E|nr:hypothetical protein [Mesorhizobium sp.]TIM14457.1 MAG: hypothetical protein E5Y67_12315 [Mesorhizobium sp.]
MPSLPFHTHTFTIPTATGAEIAAGARDDVAITPAVFPAGVQANVPVYDAADTITSVPASVTSFVTHGKATAGDRAGGEYIEGGTGPGAKTIGARSFHILPSHETISLRRAGIVPNDESAASANRTTLDALTTWCEAQKIDIEVDKATFYVTANNGLSTGWNIYPASGTGFLRVFGHGDDSVIKRAGSATLAASSALVWLYANANGKLNLENFLIDGNEANQPYDGGDLYLHEQSSNLRMRTAAIAGTFDALELYGMRMTGCVGDGFLAAASINRFVADDFKAYGRTRRVRSDIQLSRIPLVSCVVNNAEIDAFEMEPSFTNLTHQMFLSQMLVRGAFDLAGNVSGDPNPANILGTDIVALNTEGIGLNIVNMFRVKGRFKDCILTNIDRLQRCQVEFQGGEIRLRASETYTASAQPLAIWHDSANSYVKFNRTHFRLESGVSVQTGFYVQPSTAHTDLTRVMEFNNCTTDGVLDHFLAGDVYGTVTIRGGNPAATRAVISVAGSTITKENIYLEPTAEWSSAYLLRIPSAVTVTTPGDCVVAVAGEFASAKMLPIEHWSVGSITIAAGNVSNGDTVTINGHAITFVTSGAVGPQVNIGAEYLATTIALVNYINSHRADCGVSASGSSSSGIISLTAVTAGSAGNVTLAESGANITVSGGALTGGGTATTGTAITWRNTARMIVPSTPAAVIKGFPGLTSKLDMPSYGSLKEWTYEPTLAQVGRYNDSALWREATPTPAFATFTDLDTTPSVAGGRRFKASNTGATVVTALDSGVEGQEVTIVFTTANTTIDFTGTTLKGNAGVDWVPAANDHMTCVFDGTNWFCNVSDNSA